MTRLTGDPEKGAYAVLTGLVLVVMLVFAAFAVDAGNAYAQNRQLSVAADAAALAAAAKVGEQLPLGDACTPAFAASQVVLATSVANDVNSANGRVASEPVDSVTVACVDDAIEVTVANSRQLTTTLARFAGIDSLTPTGTATARYVKTRFVSGLRPWAVCDNTALLSQAQPDKTFATGLDNKVGVCSKGPTSGNWGSIDFDGGSPTAPDLAVWTRDGYPGDVEIPSLVPADPGVSGSSGLQSAFAGLVGDIVAFPSVTECLDDCQGTNAQFDAQGIITAKVCGVQYSNVTYNNDDGEISDCWEDPLAWFEPYDGRTVPNVTLEEKSDVVISLADSFTPEDAGRTVEIAGAGAKGSDLTTTILAVTSATEVQLADNSGADLELVDMVFPAQDDRVIPLGTNKKPIDHIQFRWVNYATSSYSGADPEDFCELDDLTCTGAVLLWE